MIYPEILIYIVMTASTLAILGIFVYMLLALWHLSDETESND